MRMYDLGLKREYEGLNPSQGSAEEETEADEEAGADIGEEEAVKYEELLGKIDSLLGMHCSRSLFPLFSTVIFCRSSTNALIEKLGLDA